MATVTVFSGTADARIESVNATYATARSGGTLDAQPAGTVAYVGQQTGFTVHLSYFNFDFSGSGVSAGAVITNAVLSFCVLSDNSATDFTIEARPYNWGATIETTDYIPGANLSALTLLASLTTAGLATGVTNYNNLVQNSTNLNDAIAAALAIDGILRIVVCSSRDTAGTQPTQDEYIGLYTADQALTTSDPKLVFDWAEAGQPIAKRTGGIEFSGFRTPGIARW